MWMGRRLGALVLRIPSGRRRIAEANIALCFPELDAGARTALVKANLRDIGLMLVDFALGWLGSDRRLAAIPTRIEGLQPLEAARSTGKGLRIGRYASRGRDCPYC